MAVGPSLNYLSRNARCDHTTAIRRLTKSVTVVPESRIHNLICIQADKYRVNRRGVQVSHHAGGRNIWRHLRTFDIRYTGIPDAQQPILIKKECQRSATIDPRKRAGRHVTPSTAPPITVKSEAQDIRIG